MNRELGLRLKNRFRSYKLFIVGKINIVPFAPLARSLAHPHAPPKIITQTEYLPSPPVLFQASSEKG